MGEISDLLNRIDQAADSHKAFDMFLDAVISTPDYQAVSLMYKDKPEFSEAELKKVLPFLSSQDVSELVELGPQERKKNSEFSRVMEIYGFKEYFSQNSVKEKLLTYINDKLREMAAKEQRGQLVARKPFDTIYYHLLSAFGDGFINVLQENPILAEKARLLSEDKRFINELVRPEYRYSQFVSGQLRPYVLYNYALERERQNRRI